MSVRYSSYTFPVKVSFHDDDNEPDTPEAPQPPHINIALSELSLEEREGWLTWLAERGRDGVLVVKKHRDGSYQAAVRDPLMHPNRQWRQSMPNMGAMVIPQSIFPERVKGKGNGKGKGKRKGSNASRGDRVQVRSVHWLLQIIESVYTKRFKTYSVELHEMGAEFEDFSSFVFHSLRDRFGLESLVVTKSKEMMATIQRYRHDYPEIDLFGKFLMGEFDAVDILFYLVARNKILPEALVEDPVPRGAQRFLPKKQHQVKKLVIPGRRIVPLVTLVLAKQPPEVIANVLQRLEDSEFANLSRLDVHRFMGLLVEVYHEHNMSVQESLAIANTLHESERNPTASPPRDQVSQGHNQDEVKMAGARTESQGHPAATTDGEGGGEQGASNNANESLELDEY